MADGHTARDAPTRRWTEPQPGPTVAPRCAGCGAELSRSDGPAWHTEDGRIACPIGGVHKPGESPWEVPDQAALTRLIWSAMRPHVTVDDPTDDGDLRLAEAIAERVWPTLAAAYDALVYADGNSCVISGYPLAALYAEDCDWAQGILGSAGCHPRDYRAEDLNPEGLDR